MGRLQSVAIRKPGDLPARLYGATAVKMRASPMPRGIGSTFSWGYARVFSTRGICLCLLYAFASVPRPQGRFFSGQWAVVSEELGVRS